MIHYQLRCAEAHEFDGWFSGSAAFEQQARRGLVECPTCGSIAVERALMTPAVATRDAAPPSALVEPPSAPAAAPKAMAGKVPAHVLAMLQRMRAEVEKNCDYVGPSFADEARKMHRGESDKRGIYGESTPDEAQSLAEEGIDVSHIPWVPRADG